MKKRLLIGLGAAAVIVVVAVLAATPRHHPEIRDWYDLHAIRYHLHKSFVLMNDLDATTAGYQELAGPMANDGKGWEPIGYWDPIGGRDRRFVGVFDGQGHEIRELYVNRPDESRVGLFGVVREAGVIDSVAVIDASVVGADGVGILVGWTTGTLSNSYATGEVSGEREVGGLAGGSFGIVTGCRAVGNVSGHNGVGGLVGAFYGGLVDDSHFSGRVSGGNNAGGLLGISYEGSVSNSYAAGNVTGDDRVGGLIGNNLGVVRQCRFAGSVSSRNRVGGLIGLHDGVARQVYRAMLLVGVHGGDGTGGEGFPLTPPLIPPDGIVSQCYSVGTVTGESDVGGLIGLNWALVSNSYSVADVTGYRNLGGLIGTVGGPEHYRTGYLRESYAAGEVGGGDKVGGLIGWLERGEVDRCFWDVDTSQTDESGAVIGKATTDMQTINTFADAGWEIVAVVPGQTDTAYIWNIVDGETYPFLSWAPVD